MSWHREATKDVVACDKPREAGKQALIRGCLNEETQRRNPPLPATEFIGCAEQTQGTETSKYLEEQKETSIPSVAASERGTSPNRDSSRGCGSTEGLQNRSQHKGLERPATEGDSPVCGRDRSPLTCALQSSTELVELRAKRVGPPTKAKYSSMTDSGQVGRLNDEKHGDEPS